MKKVQLGKTDVKVSPLCLGTMYFGSRISEMESFKLMDYYYEAGGRYLDTSNNYCFWIDGFNGDESELTVGKWMNLRKNRKDIFLATKCGVRPKANGDFEGVSKEAILSAVEKSLERLQTDYIDLYYIHADWRETPLEETLETLNQLVESGKVKYIACSNMSTWRFVKAKDISRRNNWAEFSGIQNWYSYLKPRENADLWVQKYVNDELLDYCETEKDTTIMAYTSTLGGMYKWETIYDNNHPALNNRFFSEDNERRFSVIKKIAEERNVSPFQIVFAWLLKHNSSIIPILGVSSTSQLQDNLESINIKLTDEEFERLNTAPFNKRVYLNEKEISLI
jgi:aryl-alcohol dehydrogenase-like predicted oxidoreductase